MRSGHRSEDQNQHAQPEHRRHGVLEELQPDVAGRELGRGDSGTDHDGDQQCRPRELGEQPTREPDLHRHAAIDFDIHRY